MSELFVKKEIKIHVPASKVWHVLVSKSYIEQWVKEFSEGNFITEDWQLGSEIEMTDDAGNVIMNGQITAFEPYKFLKIEFEDSEYSEALRLSTKDDVTLLASQAGPLEETEYAEHSSVWDKGLQKIKELSEAQ